MWCPGGDGSRGSRGAVLGHRQLNCGNWEPRPPNILRYTELCPPSVRPSNSCSIMFSASFCGGSGGDSSVCQVGATAPAHRCSDAPCFAPVSHCNYNYQATTSHQVPSPIVPLNFPSKDQICLILNPNFCVATAAAAAGH